MNNTPSAHRRIIRTLAVLAVGAAALAVPATTASASPCASRTPRDCAYQVKPPIRWGPECPMCGIRFDGIRDVITNPAIDKTTPGLQKVFVR